MSNKAKRVHIPESVQLEAVLMLVGTHRGCWLWPGTINKTTGYGHIHRLGKFFQAHRVVYTYFNGPIPTELELDHTCRNPPCVNPAHLEPVTHAVNMQRKFSAAG